MKKNIYDVSYLLLKKYGVTFFLLCCAIFVTGSMITFSSVDASWLYHTNQLQSYKNIFGFFGANCAATIIYFFGRAAILSVPFFLYGIGCYFFMMVAKKSKMITEWDRMVGVVVGFMSSLLFCQAYKLTSYDFTYSGGVVGHYLLKNMLVSFDDVSQKFIIWSLLLFSFILMTRCSYIPFFKRAHQFFCYVFNAEKLPARLAVAMYKTSMFIIVFITQAIRKICNLLTGGMLKKMDSSIVEFEHEGHADQDIDQVMHDLFWNDYVDAPKNQPVMPSSMVPASMMQINDETFVDQTDIFQDEPDLAEQEFGLLGVMENLALDKQGKKEAKEVIHFDAPKIKKKPEYKLPNLPVKKVEQKVMLEKQESLALQAKLLEDKLQQFDIKGTVVAMHAGPVVTLFEYQPDIKVKVSRILSLEDDLAMALRALSIRIIAPIPGRSVVGFEVANRDRQDVLFSTLLDSAEFQKHTGALPMIFGQDTLGNNIVADLAKMPHLLIAGSTGSGKSVALNAMLVSLLCSLKPDQLKLIIIDPKRLEFAAYDGIAHLLFPIVTETKKAIPILKWVVQTMEERYKIMASHGVRNLLDYQTAAKSNKEMEPMPLMVVIIDELADLMMTAGKAVEDSIARIAQMARAAGIHMIIATQRPSVDVITGMIKVNFPNRVAFKVTSKIDSRTILDMSGAEKLLGRGDMLFLDASKSHLVRVHGAYVCDAEIHAVVAQIKSQQTVQYLDLFEQFGEHDGDEILDTDDDLYKEVIALLQDLDEVSISMLQRRFRIGYNRSARIISALESKGLIISTEGGKTRRVVK